MEASSSERITMTVPGHLSYLPVCQSCVRAFAKKLGFADKEIAEIELSVEEAVSNVVEHAFDPDEAATFDLVCSRIPLGLEILIREKGIPFDPEALPQYDPASLGDGSAAGLGLFLMKEAMDEVSFHNLGPAGKQTRLVKYLSAKNIRQYFSADELKAHEEAAPGASQKIDYDVRLLRPEEAIEVSKCAYKSHGYTFFDDHIYYPERIIELNRSGIMISAVGVTKDNVFMGHAALVYPEPGARIAEWTFGFVNPEFRSQGFLKRSHEFLSELPKKYPLDGTYGYCVTNHVISQKTVMRFGFKDCGILLATSPSTWEFKGIEGDTSQRMSVVLSFRFVVDPGLRRLYAPAHHREMIGKLYESIGAGAELAEPGSRSEPQAAESHIETDINLSESCAEIKVKRFGSRIIFELRHQVRELCLKQIASINLFLGLEQPETFAMTAEIEKLGFFFAGILPCTDIGDALILQYLNNVPLDYGKLMLHTDLAKEILAYIQKHDPNAAL